MYASCIVYIILSRQVLKSPCLNDPWKTMFVDNTAWCNYKYLEYKVSNNIYRINTYLNGIFTIDIALNVGIIDGDSIL